MAELLDWSGVNSTDAVMVRKARRAIENAYRELPAMRRWAYYIERGRLQTNAPYSTGTIEYDGTTRAVTLTGGTWPSWARNGTLQISGIEYKVASRDSDSQITLSVNNHPYDDVAAGTSYTLWQDIYVLPVNFQEIGTVKDSQNNITLSWMEPNDEVAFRLTNMATSQPRYFSIRHDPNYLGAIGLTLFPPPDRVYNYDYMYKRAPRQLVCPQYNTGTVSTSGTTVTGVGTAWTQSMIGCVIRFGTTSSLPTATAAENPYVAQRVITSWTNATTIGIDQALGSELTTVKYEISDPIEIEAGSMYTAFLRRCEYELAVQQRRDDAPKYLQLAQQALLQAFEDDNRNMDRKPEGTRYWRRTPLYYDATVTAST